MDQISYAHSAKQSKRIKRFIADPDSSSGLVSVPKKIALGQSVTIPDGRVVVHPNLEIDGTLTIEDGGELFVPFGGTLVSSDLMHPVDTIADLRNETGKYKYVYVTGYHTKDDGAFGSNMFVWDENSTETDNGGTIIKCTTVTTGRYKLKYSGAVNVKWFGAKGDGVSNDTSNIQSTIDWVASNQLGQIIIPAGEFMITSIIWKTGVYAVGFGYDITRIKQIAGTNTDMIVSDGFGVSDISRCGIANLEIDGNYFTSQWNAPNGTLGNTSGNGIKFQGYSFVFDIGLTNIAGIGAYFVNPNFSEDSAVSDYISRISVVGKDFGKEGIIIEGPNDWIIERAWIGRAGILPRPLAESAIATSDVYSGQPVDGIVIDEANIEIGDVHVYACWSGTGFRTRNTARITKGGRVISESNRSQVNISSGTYGSAFFDIRNLSLLHPNWTNIIPSYTYPDPEWDGITIDSAVGFSAEITCRRTITSFNRVIGATGCVVNGQANVSFTYANSIAPDGDVESGSLYSGNAITLGSNKSGGSVCADVNLVNGSGVVVFSEGVKIDFTAKDCTTGLYRSSLGNSKRGNNIRGAIINCATGFQSEGTPTSERIDLSMELRAGTSAFSGDRPDLFRGQLWDISASIANADKSNRKFLQAGLSNAVTTEQTATVAHEFLYTPRYEEVQWSIDDRSTIATNLEYVYLNNINDTHLEFKYKYSTAGNPAANQRINIRVG